MKEDFTKDTVAEAEIEGKKILFSMSNKITKWRVETLFTKEPETIAWMQTFTEGDVMYDVGANVGMYSIWAAAIRGCRVMSFEPESLNYAHLNKNIFLNRLWNEVTAYPIAISDTFGLGSLVLSELATGSSGHNFKTRPNEKFPKQGAFCMSLDMFIGEFVFDNALEPTHIKIDVDGNEPLIVDGMLETLKQDKMQSVLIEVNTNDPEHMAMLKKIEECGYIFDADQVEQALITEGDFAGYVNYIFHKL